VERRIKVLGVSHKLQGLLNFREGVNVGGYTERVIGIISDESIGATGQRCRHYPDRGEKSVPCSSTHPPFLTK